MPPGGILVMLLFALLISRWLSRLAWMLVLVATALLYLLSTPWLNTQMTAGLERSTPPLPLTQLPQVQMGEHVAIVVLGGGRYAAAPEFGGDVAGSTTLMRLRYAAHLHRQTGFPLLVTGGTPLNEEVSEAQLMANSLRNDFGISEAWQEDKSANTWEHAQFVPMILKRQGVTTILLVTHASHMPRALSVFQQSPEMEGIRVMAAPTAFSKKEGVKGGLATWIPTAGWMKKNVSVLHELAGRVWYRIRYGEGI